MKITRMNKAWIFLLLSIMACLPVNAQFMPVVFDKKYGETNQIQWVSPLAGDEVALVGKEGQKYNLTWLKRDGEVLFSLPLAGYVTVNAVTEIDNNRVLIVGKAANNDRKNNVSANGRAIVVDRKGQIVASVYAGGQGAEFLKGTQLVNGAFLLAGTEPVGAGRQGILVKVDNTGKVIYQYKKSDSGYCDQFATLGNTAEAVYAVFSGDKDKEQSTIVRLDDQGKAFYITPLPAKHLKVTGLNVDVNDGSAILIGNSQEEGGFIYKIRPEGDIVFGKPFIPAKGQGVDMKYLNVARNGNILVGGTAILVGGSTDRAYYALLRSDGTSLYSGVTNGELAGMEMNGSTGESVVVTYDPSARWGNFVFIRSNGKDEFSRTVDGKFDKIRLNNRGDVMLMSSTQGRVCMYSATGEKEFDRYITENRPTAYRNAFCATSGELLFLGEGSRLVKLGHGLYVSDLKIGKPVNGVAVARFTVTLTGYATTKEGVPVPVTVGYETREQSATEANNFTPVKGRLAFTPTNGSMGNYLVKQEIEVPVKANNLIEGMKSFDLCLSDVEQSYLIKPVGKATIEDQRGVVRMVRTERGEEGKSNIMFELGLFKTDGTPLTNSTGANIIVDGAYGEGTADALDFDMTFTPRIVFVDGAQRTTFEVKTLEDTRYELPKTVVVNFNKLYSLSTTDVAFDGDLLSCTGTVVDQPALVKLTSLGDHRANENVISGLFTISLLRADGALQSNATGSDIVLNCASVPEASGKEGTDYVITNLHGLRIGGDGRQSSVNVNGVILYSTTPVDKTVKLKINNVNHPSGAQPIQIAEGGGVAEFTIRK